MAEKENSRSYSKPPVYGFLSKGGEMGKLIQEFDWSATPLGHIDNWPQSLRTALSIIVRSKFPMVLMWGENYIFFYNDAYRPSLGNDGKHPKSLGMPGSEIFSEGWDAVAPLIDKVYKQGETVQLDDLLIPVFRDGKFEDVYWTFSYSPFTNESDTIAGVFISCLESTDKVIKNQSYLENSRTLEMALEIAELGAFRIDLINDECVYSNQIQTFFSLEKQGLQLKEIFSKIHPEDQPMVIETIEKSIEGQGAGKHDLTYRVLNPITKELKYLHSVGQVIYKAGKAVSISGIIHDVTKQTLSKKIIEESEARFRSMADQSPMFVFLTDADENGKIYYFNKTFLDYIGRSLDQAVSKSWEGLVHPDDDESVRNIYLPAFQKQASYTIPAIRIRRHDGQYRWHLFKGNPRHLSNGKFIGYVGVGIDIQEQKIAIDQLELNNKKLKRTNNDLDNFIYTASHDLKAPMSNIEGLLYQLRNNIRTNAPAEDFELLLGLMEQSVIRFKNTLLDLTEISKIQREQDQDIEKINLMDVIEDVKLTIQDKIKEAQAEIEIDISAAQTINFSRKNMKSIVYNLLSNAIKYRDPLKKTSIKIKTQTSDQYIILKVIDNGLGIMEQNLDKIFTMFKRFHTHVEGTGIGLYIVKRIIDNAGGKIEVNSKEGSGTTFTIYFKRTNSY